MRRIAIALGLALTLGAVVQAEAETPRLASGDRLVSMDYKDVPVKTVLEAIGGPGEWTFLFDDKVDLEAKTTLSLSDVPVLNALRWVTHANGLFFLVRDPHTVFVAPDTRQKRLQHMPRGTRTFRLEHAEPEAAIVLLRSLLQTRQLVPDERLGTLTMEDTLEQLGLAGELIDRLDSEAGDTLDTGPFWIGAAYHHDLRTQDDPVPRLGIDMDRRVTFDLDGVTERKVYDELGKSTGLQFLFDIRIDADRPASVKVSDIAVLDALDRVNEQFGYFSVVWGPRTVFIAPDLDWKRMVEEHVGIQFFHLEHADPRAVITALRSTLQIRQIAEIPRLDAVAIRDRWERLKAAEEIVRRMDVAAVAD